MNTLKIMVFINKSSAKKMRRMGKKRARKGGITLGKRTLQQEIIQELFVSVSCMGHYKNRLGQNALSGFPNLKP